MVEELRKYIYNTAEEYNEVVRYCVEKTKESYPQLNLTDEEVLEHSNNATDIGYLYNFYLNSIENFELLKETMKIVGNRAWDVNNISPYRCRRWCPYNDGCNHLMLKIDGVKMCYGQLVNKYGDFSMKTIEELLQHSHIKLIDKSGNVRADCTRYSDFEQLVSSFILSYFLFILNDFGTTQTIKGKNKLIGENVIKLLKPKN